MNSKKEHRKQCHIGAFPASLSVRLSEALRVRATPKEKAGFEVRERQEGLPKMMSIG